MHLWEKAQTERFAPFFSSRHGPQHRNQMRGRETEQPKNGTLPLTISAERFITAAGGKDTPS